MNPSPDAADPDSASAAYRYHLLRAATERFRCNIPALSEPQRAEAEHQARKTYDLERRVLDSTEAQTVVVPDTQLHRAYLEIRQRYADPQELKTDLARNGLTVAQLRQALWRELVFDAVLKRIGANVTSASDAEAQQYYDQHPERFTTPEQRRARHILITINEGYAENSRDAARMRIAAIAADLNDSIDTLQQAFIEQARRHSECPTAMDGGQLGILTQGTLYPALDAALFALAEGALSGVLESDLGFHLILCETIHPARALCFQDVQEQIRQALTQRRITTCQRTWLAGLGRVI